MPSSAAKNEPHVRPGSQPSLPRCNFAVRDSLVQSDFDEDPSLYPELPSVLVPYLAGKELPWFRIAVKLSEGRVDPFYRELAKRTSEQELVLGAGSDVVQIILGVPKQLRGGLTEVNRIVAVDAGIEELFEVYEDMEFPEFRGRKAGKAHVVLNWESSIDLQLIINNAANGNYLLHQTSGRLNNPLKHNAVAHIPAEGQAYLFFRTVDDYVNFHNKVITLPEIERISAFDWLMTLDNEHYNHEIQYVLQYAATIYERARQSGWVFSPQSITFLRTIAEELPNREQREVRAFVRRNFRRSKIPYPTINDTFRELGIDDGLAEPEAAEIVRNAG